MDAGAALELQPSAPLGRLEQSRDGMTKTVVVRDRKIRERTGGQTGQRARAGENNPNPGAIFFSEKLRTEESDRIRLFEGVGADHKTVVRRGFRFAAHFRFTEQGVAARLPW